MDDKQKQMIERLTKNLNDSLELYDGAPEEVLLNQAKLLDLSFRKCLTGIDSKYGGGICPTQFAAALKAQNQYRYTFRELQSRKKPQGGAHA
jgi:hypothetical protein